MTARGEVPGSAPKRRTSPERARQMEARRKVSWRSDPALLATSMRVAKRFLQLFVAIALSATVLEAHAVSILEKPDHDWSFGFDSPRIEGGIQGFGTTGYRSAYTYIWFYTERGIGDWNGFQFNIPVSFLALAGLGIPSLVLFFAGGVWLFTRRKQASPVGVAPTPTVERT